MMAVATRVRHAGSHGKAYISYRGVAVNECFLRNSHARALIESARA